MTTMTAGSRGGILTDEVRHEQQMDGNRLHRSYVILSAEERAKGFVRPVRLTYVHVTCGARRR